jgi:hypothetical protein
MILVKVLSELVPEACFVGAGCYDGYNMTPCAAARARLGGLVGKEGRSYSVLTGKSWAAVGGNKEGVVSHFRTSMLG